MIQPESMSDLLARISLDLDSFTIKVRTFIYRPSVIRLHHYISQMGKDSAGFMGQQGSEMNIKERFKAILISAGQRILSVVSSSFRANLLFPTLARFPRFPPLHFPTRVLHSRSLSSAIQT